MLHTLRNEEGRRSADKATKKLAHRIRKLLSQNTCVYVVCVHVFHKRHQIWPHSTWSFSCSLSLNILTTSINTLLSCSRTAAPCPSMANCNALAVQKSESELDVTQYISGAWWTSISPHRFNNKYYNSVLSYYFIWLTAIRRSCHTLRSFEQCSAQTSLCSQAHCQPRHHTISWVFSNVCGFYTFLVGVFTTQMPLTRTQNV